ncbi:MAG: hypothetical protein ACQGVK_23510 [Myxococcota bacterium]
MRRQLRVPALSLLSASLLLAACASPVQLVEPPARKADLFPSAMRSGSLVVAVDSVREPRRAIRYFGTDLRAQGLLPAQIIVTNLGDTAIEVDPADVLVQQGRSVVDPVPVAQVAAYCKESSGLTGGEEAALIDAHFAKLGFTSTLVAPGETVRGWMFFDLGVDEEDEIEESPWFRVVSLHGSSHSVGLRVAVTENGTHQRLHFGPYRLDR